MLSYRHAFHAGNFADVLKHSALALILDYFTRKDKGFSYIDSHSGAGMYQLASEQAQKTGEYQQGIEKLFHLNSPCDALLPYLEYIKALNPNKLALYPGSPAIAQYFMRRQDSAHLYELHPADNILLTEYCQRWRKAKIYQSDGYKGVLAQLPPATRRGIVLIDPPFELKEDYEKAVNTVIEGYRKFATGCYIIWYPVVTRSYINRMSELLLASPLKNVLQAEYCQTPDSDEYGMTGTGLFIVNPPWQLPEQLTEILTAMKTTLGNERSSVNVTQLIAE